MEDPYPPPASTYGSNEWVDLNGTVHVRTVLNGRAQLEEIEANASALSGCDGHGIEGFPRLICKT
jgi:hypothetical protein